MSTMAQRYLLKPRSLHLSILRLFHVDFTNLHLKQCFKYRSLLYSDFTKNGNPVSKAMFAMCRKCRMNFMDFKNRSDFITRREFSSSSKSQRKILSSSTVLNLPSVKQIEQFLSSKKIPFEHGHTSIFVDCSSCSKKTEKAGKKGEMCLYINKTTGSYFCRNCGRSGSWRNFKEMMSDPASGDTTSSTICDKDTLYAGTSATSTDTNTKALELWQEGKPLVEADNQVKNTILEKFSIQNISEEFLEKYQVHVADYKFSERDGTSRPQSCIIFPWFDSKKTVVHGVKLLRLDQEDDGSIAMQPRLGVLGLFGWNTVPSDAKEIVLTLNEFDAIAVNQATSYPAISLPLGTHSLPPEVLPHLEQFQRIILWFGDDVRSRQAANQFSKKLSIHRCHIVRPTCEIPPAGALDALNKGIDLEELITSSKPISHEKIAIFQELRNEVYSEFVNADQVAGVKWTRFPKLNALLKGHRRGELTIFTGPTGAGKTTLLSEMSVDLCQQGVNTLWGSFEIRNVRLAKIMMNQFSGLDLQKNVEQFNYWADKFEMLPMYFMCFYGSQNISTVIETMAHAVYVFDIDHIVIDNLQFMTSNLRAEDRFSVQSHAISSLRSFASSKNVHVTLVIHPRKENDDVELQTASIFGTAKASQEADNVLILQDKKGRGEKYLQVTKNRFDGTVGRLPLDFVKSSLSMCGFGKKDTSLRKATNLNKKSESQVRSSKVTSDIDMVNFYNGPTVEKDAFTTKRVKAYSPGTLNLESERPGESKSTFNEASCNDTYVKAESNPTFKDKFSPGEYDAVRAFQGGLDDSIKSKSFKDLGQVFPQPRGMNHRMASPGKAGIVQQNTPGGESPLSKRKGTKNVLATKLGSLSSNVKNTRVVQRKVVSFGRIKVSSNLLSMRKETQN